MNWLYLRCRAHKILKYIGARAQPHIVRERPRGALSKTDRNNYIRAECGQLHIQTVK